MSRLYLTYEIEQRGTKPGVSSESNPPGPAPWTADGRGVRVRLMPTTRSRARWLLLALAASSLVAGAGCSAPSAPHPAPTPAPGRLVASVTQFRFDEGTRTPKAGVPNASDTDVRASQATIAGAGSASPTVPVPGGVAPPGQPAAFSIAYGAPQCSAPP